VRQKIELKRGADGTTVQAYLVDLGQKHLDDYTNHWVETLKLLNQDKLEYDNLVFFEYGILKRG